MNTRGLVELIALNVGLSTKILSIELFTVFVLMAIFTTLMTSPLLSLFYNHKWDHLHELPKYRTADYKIEGGVIDNGSTEKLQTDEQIKEKKIEISEN